MARLTGKHKIRGRWTSVELASLGAPTTSVVVDQEDFCVPQLVVFLVIEGANDQPGPEAGPGRGVEMLADDELGSRIRQRTNVGSNATGPVGSAVRGGRGVWIHGCDGADHDLLAEVGTADPDTLQRLISFAAQPVAENGASGSRVAAPTNL